VRGVDSESVVVIRQKRMRPRLVKFFDRAASIGLDPRQNFNGGTERLAK